MKIKVIDAMFYGIGAALMVVRIYQLLTGCPITMSTTIIDIMLLTTMIFGLVTDILKYKKAKRENNKWQKN